MKERHQVINKYDKEAMRIIHSNHDDIRYVKRPKRSKCARCPSSIPVLRVICWG